MEGKVIHDAAPVKEAIKDITVNQKLINGTQLLLIYYGVIIFFFAIDILIEYRSQRHPHTVNFRDRGPFFTGIYNLYESYRKYGFITLNSIIYIVCISIIIYSIGIEWNLIFAVTVSIILYTFLMKILLRVFINKNNYEDDATIRSINLILYTLLGNFFCLKMSFITQPNLTVNLAGLTFALLLCFYIMLHAIFNPEILKKSASKHILYSQAFGIVKGMTAVVICMLATLYLMVLSCYQANPHFYALEYLKQMDQWDILYYLITSFTTIGYGDIVPVRYDGMFYSMYVAILIGISSMFTTTCFIAAVISTTNSVAKHSREGKKKDRSVSELNVKELRKVIEKSIRHYEKDKQKNESSTKAEKKAPDS